MRIVLAVDDSAYSDAAVKALIDQLRPAEHEVRVLHAVDWFHDVPQSFMFGEGPTAGADVIARRDESVKKAAQLVGRVSERLRAAGFPTTTITPEGDPRHSIIDCATQWNADLIVMGSHGRRGLDRLLLGSVAEAVIRHAPCSVQVIRLTPSTAASTE